VAAEHLADLVAQARFAAPPEVGLENLAHRSLRRGHAQGVSRTMSTEVPSAMNGMSSTGTILEMTPLLPCRPAILSPGCRRRFTAT